MPPNDPTSGTPEANEKIRQATETLKHYNVALDNVTQNTGFFNEKTEQTNGILHMTGMLADQASSLMGNFSATMSKSLEALNSKAGLTTGQLMKLSGAMTVFGAVGDPFRGIARSDSLNTIGDQIQGLISKMDESQVVNFASKMGIHLPTALVKAAGSAKGLLMAMTTNADSATRMEDVYMRGAAATGELGNVHLAAGAHLEHMNRIVAQQREMMEKAGDATGMTSEQMAGYYNQLRLVPGALKEMTSEQTKAIGGTDVLTATVRLARGTGMEYADVINDMHTAVRNYNADLPTSMKFTAQISELSQKYGVELSDVQKELVATSETFKYFGAGAEGASEIMNEMVGTLKATGISGAVASDITGNMTRQLGQLTIAQRAFLSTQQGGPAGLMGAFHIDNLMKSKEGMRQVFDMTKNQLIKMMGPLVTTQQAEQSPQAAAQMTKQILMLRQGPLGQFARTDQEAEHIVDALASGKTDTVTALAETMKDPMEKGLDYQKQTSTYAGQIYRLLQHGAGTAAQGALDMLQSGTTAGAGEKFADENLQSVQDMRSNLTNFMVDQGKASTKGDAGIRLLNNIVATMKQAPTAASAAFEGIGHAMAPEGTPEREMGQSNFADTSRQETSMKQIMASNTNVVPPRQQISPEMGQSNFADTSRQETSMKQIMASNTNVVPPRQQISPEMGQSNTLETSLAAIQNIPDLPGFGGPGASLGTAAGAVSGRQRTTATGAPHDMATHPNTPADVGTKNLGQITVHVEGYCLDCGEKMRSRSQSYAVAPQTK
jgi:hypothetical protein